LKADAATAVAGAMKVAEAIAAFPTMVAADITVVVA
jgi:ABC-type transporter Mla maintaining outer membrane lipid asymmetry permease subunit MlaE